jgi:hypothetical protein
MPCDDVRHVVTHLAASVLPSGELALQPVTKKRPGIPLDRNIVIFQAGIFNSEAPYRQGPVKRAHAGCESSLITCAAV